MTPTPTSTATMTEPLSPQEPQGRPHGIPVGRTVYVRGGFNRLGGVYRAINETAIEKLPINRKERRRRLKLNRTGR